jgi:DNA-binding transcriptional MerR regulator
MKTGELAALLRVSENTLRNWSREYAEFLTERGRGAQPGATREFDEHDVYTLATIAELRDRGLTINQVKSDLRGGYRAVKLPQRGDPDIEAARDRVELVPAEAINLWMERVQNLQAELARLVEMHQAEVQRLVSERDEARSEAKESQDRRIDAEKRAARLEGEIAQLLIRLQEAQQRGEQEAEQYRQKLEDAMKRLKLFGGN